MRKNRFLGVQQPIGKKWGIRFGIGLLFGVAALMSFLSMGIAPVWVAVLVGLGSMALSLISQKSGAFPKSKWGIGLLIVLGVASIILSGLTLGGAIPALSSVFMVTKDTGHWVNHSKDTGYWSYHYIQGHYVRGFWKGDVHWVMEWVPNILTTKEWVPHMVRVLSISKEAVAGIAIAVSSMGPVIAAGIRGIEKFFKVSAKKPIKTYSRHPNLGTNEFSQGRRQGRSYARYLKKIGTPNKKQSSSEDNETKGFLKSSSYEAFSPMTELSYTFPSQGGRGVQIVSQGVKSGLHAYFCQLK